MVRSITVPFDDRYRFCSVLDGGTHSGVQFYFIDYPPFFDRERSTARRWATIATTPSASPCFRAPCWKPAKILGAPDVLPLPRLAVGAGAHPAARRSMPKIPAFARRRSVFTIHNMGYQGLFPPETLPLLMLPWDLFTIDKLEFYGKVNFLKGALVFSDFITTVSRKYSQEIQTAEYGFGLEGVLRGARRHRHRHPQWRGLRRVEPADRYVHRRALFARGPRRQGEVQAGPAGANSVFATPIPQLPVIGIVSRFAAQKGFDLISQVADRLAREEMIVVALGTGDKEYEDLFRRLNKQFPQKFAVKIAYDNALAHKIEAGADMFLMPSRYEPCGLNQIYSLKYGTVPVVRATGGLDDTIEQLGPAHPQGNRLQVHRVQRRSAAGHHPRRAAGVSRQGKLADADAQRHEEGFFLDRSAREYVKIYERVRQLRSVTAA